LVHDEAWALQQKFVVINTNADQSSIEDDCALKILTSVRKRQNRFKNGKLFKMVQDEPTFLCILISKVSIESGSAVSDIQKTYRSWKTM